MIRTAKKTKKESVTDAPYINNCFEIHMEKSEDSSIIYYYEDSGEWYFEVPYVGIYMTNQDLENMVGKSI